MRVNTTTTLAPSTPKIEVVKPPTPEVKSTPIVEAPEVVDEATGYRLPTAKSKAQTDVSKLKWLIYGERKIGKTSFASCFPDAIFLMFEAGGEGLEIAKVEIDHWAHFKVMVDMLTEKNEDGRTFKHHSFKNVVIDTGDKCLAFCTASVMQANGIKHPTDMGFGKGWDLVSNELARVCDKIPKAGLGLIVLSHATEKQFKERTGGEYDKIVPTMQTRAFNYFGGLADGTLYYGYWGDTRLLTISGSDSVEAGQRLKFQFWVKGKIGVERVHSIPCGNKEEDAFANFLKAFNNEQEVNGAPAKNEFAALSDIKVPLKSEKKK